MPCADSMLYITGPTCSRFMRAGFVHSFTTGLWLLPAVCRNGRLAPFLARLSGKKEIFGGKHLWRPTSTSGGVLLKINDLLEAVQRGYFRLLTMLGILLSCSWKLLESWLSWFLQMCGCGFSQPLAANHVAPQRLFSILLSL